jgi:polyferredoxin
MLERSIIGDVTLNRKILRILIQLLILGASLLIPILDLFRFDINTSTIYLWNQVWSFGIDGEHNSGSLDFLIKGVLPWFVIILSFPIWGAILGRFFCGWLCPVSTLIERGDFLIKQSYRVIKYFRRSDNRDNNDLIYGFLSGLLLISALIILSLIFSAFLISLTEILRQIYSLEFSSNLIFVFIGMMGLIVATVVLAKRMLCNYVCLFGIVQMLAALVSPISLRVNFDQTNAKRCTNCRGCERACIMELKPRLLIKVSTSCINCGECITACEMELGKNRLFHYKFGKGTFGKGSG